MSDEAEFLAMILADPADDTHRLVFADWLQEHAVNHTCGHCDAGKLYGRELQSLRPADAWHACPKCGGTGRNTDGRGARAEFIRVQCELANLHKLQHSGAATHEDTERMSILLKRESELTLAVYPRIIWPVGDWLRALGIDPGASAFNRGGWLAEITCTAVAWITHGDAIRAAHPVTRVRLTTVPGDPPPDDWAQVLMALASPGRILARVCGRDVEAQSPHVPDLLSARWPGVTFELPQE